MSQSVAHDPTGRLSTRLDMLVSYAPYEGERALVAGKFWPTRASRQSVDELHRGVGGEVVRENLIDTLVDVCTAVSRCWQRSSSITYPGHTRIFP